jgi:hypothetical protein
VRLCASGLRGPSGNVEFFALIERTGAPYNDLAIDAALAEVPA